MINPESSIYLFYGPPASGKSTVAREVSSQLKLEYLSVGEITRNEITKNSILGRELKKYLDEVVEYPVELITQVVEERILDAKSNSKGFILDGYPKYDWEAEAFLNLMNKHNFPLDKVVVLDVPMDTAIARVSNRRMCTDCLTQFDISENNISNCIKCGGNLIIREDDEPTILRRRYGDYDSSINKTLQVLNNHYRSLAHFDGTKSPQQVLSEIKDFLNKPE